MLNVILQSAVAPVGASSLLTNIRLGWKWLHKNALAYYTTVKNMILGQLKKRNYKRLIGTAQESKHIAKSLEPFFTDEEVK